MKKYSIYLLSFLLSTGLFSQAFGFEISSTMAREKIGEQLVRDINKYMENSEDSELSSQAEKKEDFADPQIEAGIKLITLAAEVIRQEKGSKVAAHFLRETAEGFKNTGAEYGFKLDEERRQMLSYVVQRLEEEATKIDDHEDKPSKTKTPPQGRLVGALEHQRTKAEQDRQEHLSQFIHFMQEFEEKVYRLIEEKKLKEAESFIYQVLGRLDSLTEKIDGEQDRELARNIRHFKAHFNSMFEKIASGSK